VIFAPEMSLFPPVSPLPVTLLSTSSTGLSPDVLPITAASLTRCAGISPLD
jgi:hypothetical protein